MGNRLLAYAIAALMAAAWGCSSGDLGECNLDGTTISGEDIDGPAAFDIAYRQDDGLPMFEGQALLQSSCGNGQFCHTPNAVGGDRFGSPAGLNFDVGLACAGETVDATCANLQPCDGTEGQSEYCERLELLQTNQSYTASWGEGIISEIREGTMPPGAIGKQVMDDRPWIREDGTPLPEFGTSDATDIVRNWLACGAPVVARTEQPPSPADQLTNCDSLNDEICIYSGPTAPLPEPQWSSIYDAVILPQCVLCHQPGGPGFFVLDLTGPDPDDMSDWASAAHAALVGVSASPNGPCAAQGINVIAGDPDGSLMIQKMRAVQTCGDEMPIAGGVQTIPNPVIEVIEQWILDGAPND